MGITKHMNQWILFSLIFTLQGCSIFVDFKDISHEKEYAGLINKSYKTNVKLLIHGINMDNPIEKHIDEYVITTKPGFAGRYVLYYNDLPIGSVIKIKKAQRCTNCYLDFNPRIKFQVEILSSHNLKKHPIYLKNNFGNNAISSIINNTAIINLEIMEIIK